MVGMISCILCMFCPILGSRMFVNIAQICFMIENSQNWYILDQYWWLVWFLVFCVCFVLFWDPECLWIWLRYVLWLKILRNGTSWISIDDWNVFLNSVYVFLAKRASTDVFSLSKSFWKSCISPEYFSCDNFHFSPSNLVLQLLRATKWCRNIFPIFPKKFHLNQRCGDDGCASHVLDDLF